MLPPMRMKGMILLTVLLSMMACAVQASTFAMPGIGTVNGLAVEIVKVTTNPTGAMDVVDRTGPVGGSSVSVYVKVQYGNAITSINSVTVNIRESGVQTSSGSLSLTSYTQLADSGSGDATVHTRVYTGTWNTLTTTPLIYNANYCFKATIDYNRNNSHASPAVDSDEVSVPVKNLVIQTISPEDYFVTAPGTGSVQFSITLEDYSSSLSYSLKLTIRHSETNTSVIRTITQTVTGLTHTITWNLMDDNGDPAAPYGGYFTYDLEVSKTGDNQRYRSQFLSVTDSDVYFETDDDDQIICDSSGNVHTLYKYKLSEMPKAGTVTIHFYKDGAFVSSTSNLSDQNRWDPPSGPVSAWLALNTPPSVRGIITAKDTHESEYRNRLPKRVLCKNGPKSAYTKGSCFTYKLVGEQTEPGWLYEWRWVTPGQTTPSVNSSWPGNSGNHSRMNSYSVSGGIPVYWLPLDEATNTGGAVPESSLQHNTVAENRFYSNTGMECYLLEKHPKLWATTSIDLTDPHDTATVWRDPNNPSSFKQYDDPDAPSEDHVYRKWKINVCDWDLYRYPGGAPYYIHRLVGDSMGTEERSGIQIHEDGNYGMTDASGSYTGSVGCIALKPGNMESFWTRFNNVEKYANYSRYKPVMNVTLQVYHGDYTPSKNASMIWTTWESGTNQ